MKRNLLMFLAVALAALPAAAHPIPASRCAWSCLPGWARHGCRDPPFRRAPRQGAGPAVLRRQPPGAGGNIGTAAAHSPADGYTLLMGTVATQTMNEFLYASTGYNPDEFAPISLSACCRW